MFDEIFLISKSIFSYTMHTAFRNTILPMLFINRIFIHLIFISLFIFQISITNTDLAGYSDMHL